jgi:hypothetical protein
VVQTQRANLTSLPQPLPDKLVELSKSRISLVEQLTKLEEQVGQLQLQLNNRRGIERVIKGSLVQAKLETLSGGQALLESIDRIGEADDELLAIPAPIKCVVHKKD